MSIGLKKQKSPKRLCGATSVNRNHHVMLAESPSKTRNSTFLFRYTLGDIGDRRW